MEEHNHRLVSSAAAQRALQVLQAALAPGSTQATSPCPVVKPAGAAVDSRSCGVNPGFSSLRLTLMVQDCFQALDHVEGKMVSSAPHLRAC